MGDFKQEKSMTTPQLSPPTLFTSAELEANESLAIAIRDLCNQAFSRHKDLDTEKWNNETFRFSDLENFHAMLTPESVFAVIFDTNESSENGVVGAVNSVDSASKFKGGKVVACAAAVPWKGGWAKEGAGMETGWEMKTVCVDAHPKCLRKGLAVQLLISLERYLIDEERSRVRAKGVESGQGQLDLWILAAECLNGVYWRKRGYEKVRSKIEGAGVWSCKTTFEMTVLRKTLFFDVAC